MTAKNLTPSDQPLTTRSGRAYTNERYVSPPVDIFETAEGLTLIADVPGLDDKTLQVHVDQGVLTIEGRAASGAGELLYREFAMAGYWRQFQLPESFDAAQATARVVNGVLTLHLPKAESAKPRRIAVTTH